MTTDIENTLISQLKVHYPKKIVVFGAGSGGKQTLAILEQLNIKVEYVIDNNENLTGTMVLNYPINNATEFVSNCHYDDYIILVASTYYDEISFQLSEEGMIENIHYISAWGQKRENHYFAGYFAALAKKKREKIDFFLFGDSVYSFIANEDKDRTILHDMLVDRLNKKHSVEIVHHPGFHLGVFYSMLNALAAINRLPKVVVIPINLRSLAPIWDLNPNQSWIETMKEINQLVNFYSGKIPYHSMITQKISYEDFIGRTHEYPGIGKKSIAEIISWNHNRGVNRDSLEQEYRMRMLFSSHYLLPLKSDNRKLQLLRSIVTLCRKHNTSLFSYVTPINYEFGLKNFNGDELKNLNNNIQKLNNLFEDEKNRVFKDYSQTITSDGFRHENYPAEHLNHSGRNKLTSTLIGDLEVWINKIDY